MIEQDDFVRWMLASPAAVGEGVGETSRDAATDAADDILPEGFDGFGTFGDDDIDAISAGDAIPEGFDGFDADAPAPGIAALEDRRFAQRLLEASGFGPGELVSRAEVIVGRQQTARFMRPGVVYWPKLDEGGRPYHILLFELATTAAEILDGPFTRAGDQLEDVLHRVVQDALEGFERESRDRPTDSRKGSQTDTLCIVSVTDDRRRPRDAGEAGPARKVVCFGTKCHATESLETFTLLEEARDWAATDGALARAYLERWYQRHFRRLGEGTRWQDAFISGAERRKATALLEACAAPAPDREAIERRVGALLEEIARSFGLPGRSSGRHLVRHPLPENHSIGVEPEVARRAGFVNPLRGHHYFAADSSLVGYFVYLADPRADADAIRRAFAQSNRFHNVLVIYPAPDGAQIELWQGRRPLPGRLLRGPRRSRFEGEGRVVQVIARFFAVSGSGIEDPATLAAELAWRAQHVRAIVLDELAAERSRAADDRPLNTLLEDFNNALATLDDGAFADAYAQTIAYGLLAARWLDAGRGARLFVRRTAADMLPRTSPLLRDLFARLIGSRFDHNLVWLLDDIAGLLARTLVESVFGDDADPAIHFYEHFLEVYDPEIRKKNGVYYTPDEVVSYIVRTTHAALQDPDRFDLPLGLADATPWHAFAAARGIAVPEGIDGDTPFVQILDPATGTGTFLLRVIEVVHAEMQARFTAEGLDETAAEAAWVAYVRAELLPRLHGFELMVAPYVICHLRLGLKLKETGFEFADGDQLRVRLTNTLEMRAAQLEIGAPELAREAEQAAQVKESAPISVIVGNPPYEREPAAVGDRHKGGWVRAGWNDKPPLLDDYTEPARAVGAGGDLKNIYNLYVYFWRWATWRVFDRYAAPGIVAFITASSYLRGPGFVGMREEMQRVADDIFVLDLEGDQRGTRVTDNVFSIMVPVAVASLIATAGPDRETAGTLHYHRVEGDRAAKLSLARQTTALDQLTWSPAEGELGGVFLAGGAEVFLSLPFLTDLFPWQHSGAQYKRTWPIECDIATLSRRWDTLIEANADERAALFKETRDRKVDRSYQSLLGSFQDEPLTSLESGDQCPRSVRLGFRSFDRHWCLPDSRLGDYLRPVLWHIQSARQVYLTSLLGGILGTGPAATVSAFVPDLHHFRGSYGGKDVIPLWRDPDGCRPNIARGLLDALTAAHGARPRAEDVFAYAYAVLANPGYVTRFEDELQVPGPRLPVTGDRALFARGAALGRALLRWHTYGERFADDDFELTGEAQVVRVVPGTAEDYPARHRYDADTGTLHVGDGAIAPVSEAVWAFSVSGLQVVKSWLDYRMKRGAGRKSSPLDDIRPERWTDEMTRELLDLLWVLAWTIEQYPALDAWLDDVLQGPLLAAADIPAPTAAERKPPAVERRAPVPQASLDL